MIVPLDESLLSEQPLEGNSSMVPAPATDVMDSGYVTRLGAAQISTMMSQDMLTRSSPLKSARERRMLEGEQSILSSGSQNPSKVPSKNWNSSLDEIPAWKDPKASLGPISQLMEDMKANGELVGEDQGAAFFAENLSPEKAKSQKSKESQAARSKTSSNSKPPAMVGELHRDGSKNSLHSKSIDSGKRSVNLVSTDGMADKAEKEMDNMSTTNLLPGVVNLEGEEQPLEKTSLAEKGVDPVKYSLDGSQDLRKVVDQLRQEEEQS